MSRRTTDGLNAVAVLIGFALIIAAAVRIALAVSP